MYDLIIGANGYHSIIDYKRSLNPKGRYVMTGGTGAQMAQALLFGPLISMFGSKKLGSLAAKANRDDLLFLGELLESGKLVPFIGSQYKLSEITDAFKYLDMGHSQGKVIINID